MIADVLTSIKAYLYDRTSSPLLGAFATSLALWNFKILMLFFSKTPYAVKVWEIDFFYSQPFFSSIDNLSWLTNYWMCLYLMPSVTSLFYIYVFPWFSHKVFEFSYNKQIALNNKKKEMQGSELISTEEKEELLSSIEKLNIENRANVLKSREEITQLESRLDSVIQEREELKSNNNELLVKLSEMERKQGSEAGDDVLQTIPVSSSNVDTSNWTLKVNEKQNVNLPSYLNYYETLDWSHKEITEKVLSALLDRNYSFDELCIEITHSSDIDFVSESSALRRHLGKMKLYDIIESSINKVGEELYVLTSDGKELYKYILEKDAPMTPVFA